MNRFITVDFTVIFQILFELKVTPLSEKVKMKRNLTKTKIAHYNSSF